MRGSSEMMKSALTASRAHRVRHDRFYKHLLATLRRCSSSARTPESQDVGVNLKGNDLNNFAPRSGLAGMFRGLEKVRRFFAPAMASITRRAAEFHHRRQHCWNCPGINLVGSGGTGITSTPSTFTTSRISPFQFRCRRELRRLCPSYSDTADRSLRSARITVWCRTSRTGIWKSSARSRTTRRLKFVISAQRVRSFGARINLNQIDALHRNKELFDAFNAGSDRRTESALLINCCKASISAGPEPRS